MSFDNKLSQHLKWIVLVYKLLITTFTIYKTFLWELLWKLSIFNNNSIYAIYDRKETMLIGHGEQKSLA